MVELEAWCRDSPGDAAKSLKLGPKSVDELANNVFSDAPLLPAIERYTGVLYSATGVADWTPKQREWAATRVFVHSSLFGIVASADEIPAYRLSHDSKVRGVPLKNFWLGHASDAIREMAAGDWVLDCRSEGYRALAPIPADVQSLYLDVVTADGGKALNHFNKVHKGDFVWRFVHAMNDVDRSADLSEWARVKGLSITVIGERAVLAV